MAGRKSLKDEVGILRRYADLTEPYFKFLNQMLTSPNKKDKMWAAEQLKGAFPKFIPQQVGGIDGQPIQVSWIQSLPFLTNPEPGQIDSTLRVHAG